MIKLVNIHNALRIVPGYIIFSNYHYPLFSTLSAQHSKPDCPKACTNRRKLNSGIHTNTQVHQVQGSDCPSSPSAFKELCLASPKLCRPLQSKSLNSLNSLNPSSGTTGRAITGHCYPVLVQPAKWPPPSTCLPSSLPQVTDPSPPSTACGFHCSVLRIWSFLNIHRSHNTVRHIPKRTEPTHVLRILFSLCFLSLPIFSGIYLKVPNNV